jgi:hypothetical protein
MNQMTEAAHLAPAAYDSSRAIVAGDILCITGGPYPRNFGKLLRVVKAHPSQTEIEATPIDENNTLFYCDGMCEDMQIGPGEIAVIYSRDVRVVT